MSLWQRFLRLIRPEVVEWVDCPNWNEDDAQGLEIYLKSESGKKLKLYLRNYVLRLQSEAVISDSNLRYKCGYCGGAKSTLTQIEALADTENFTAEEAETPEIP